jgi:penicillin-binding protein 1A
MRLERRPRWRRGVRLGLRATVILAVGLPILVGTSAMAALGLLLFGDLPGTVPEENPQVESFPSYVYDVEGNLIGSFREFDLTVPMAKEDVPDVLADAVIAAEDRKFWSHQGVDPEGIVRAAWAIYQEGRVVQGGSTITQQYARLKYLNQEQTLSRKLNEAVLATRLERDLAEELGSTRAAKEEILYQYLDLSYFGGGAYGAGAAAQTYFRKDVKDLNASEAAALVGVLPSPSTYGPRDNLPLAEQHRRDVLGDMLEVGSLTDAEYLEAVAADLWFTANGPPPEGRPWTIVHPTESAGADVHPYFVDYVRRYLQATGFTDEQIFRGGLRIETTLDGGLQEKAVASVAESLEGTEWPLEMALVSMEPSTGYVKALVGGRDFAASEVNLALGGSVGMQAGSSFKPFTSAAALEAGLGVDTALPPGPYTPPGRCTNPDGCELSGNGGPMPEAMASSSNSYFAQLVDLVGPDRTAELANRVGVSRITLDREYDWTLTLGAYEVSPLDMAQGFATLDNHGVRVDATPVVRVLSHGGAILADHTVPVATPVLAPAIADTVTELMRGVVTGGTGRAADIGRPAAGKTGTANENKAAWFVGYTPQLVTSVWMGYADEPKPLVNIKGSREVGGGGIPAATWGRYMRAAHEGVEVLDFTKPGPLPPPDAPVELRSAGRRQSPARVVDDCGRPCVQTTQPPADGWPAPDGGATTTTSPPGPAAPTTTSPPATSVPPSTAPGGGGGTVDDPDTPP